MSIKQKSLKRIEQYYLISYNLYYKELKGAVMFGHKAKLDSMRYYDDVSFYHRFNYLFKRIEF